MGLCGGSCKGLKICIVVTAIFLVIVFAILVILYYTVFKPKDPKINPQPVTLEQFTLIFFPLIKLNVTLGVVVTISNQNYGSFKYHESTAYVTYRGNIVAEAPITNGTIPAQRTHNISISLAVYADKLGSDPNFKSDFDSGVLNFTSTTTLRGKVKLLKLFKAKATSYSTCDISLFIQAQMAGSVCKSKLKL